MRAFYFLFFSFFFFSLLLGAPCPVCHRSFPEKYQFCPFDGKRLWHLCKTCQRPLRPEWRFCPFDGTPQKKGEAKGKKVVSRVSAASSEMKKEVKPQPKSLSNSLQKRPKSPPKVAETKHTSSKGKVTTSVPTGRKKDFGPTSLNLPPLDLVKLFLKAIEEGKAGIVRELIDWESYFEWFLREVRGVEPRRGKGWQKALEDFQRRVLRSLLSENNRKLLRVSKKHYLVKIRGNHFQILVSGKVGEQYWQNIFTLKKVRGIFRIAALDTRRKKVASQKK